MADLLVSKNAPCPCGSGKKFKKCCLHKRQEGSIYEGPKGFNPRAVFSDGAELLTPRPKPKSTLQAIGRVLVHYTFGEQFGFATVHYCFPIGRLFLLDGGLVLPVEKLEVGMRFVMQTGQIATVTHRLPAEWWEPPWHKPYKGNQYERRIVGWVEHVGNVVIDLSIAGETITTTPDHLFWSVTRNTYIPAAYLQVNETFKTKDNETVYLWSASPPRYGLVKLYNLEVEEFHNYFVGHAGILVHNGFPGGACGVPLPAEVTESEVELIAAERLSVRTPRQLGLVAAEDHHIFPQAVEQQTRWFSSRGVNIHEFTVTPEGWEHDLIHDTLGWNDEIMSRLISGRATLGIWPETLGLRDPPNRREDAD